MSHDQNFRNPTPFARDIYGKLEADERAEYQRRYPREEEAMATYMQQRCEEARREGMQQGMQQGEAALLLRQLERKFGREAAAACRERVQRADADTLLEWSERILTAETIDEVIH